MQLKALRETVFTLDKPKIVLGGWFNTMRDTFSPPRQIARGSWSQSRCLRREPRLDGLSFSSKGPKESESDGCSIMQLRSIGIDRATRRRAEGSGSTHTQEFVQYLNIARRSLFEDASMLLVFERLVLLESTDVDELLWACDEASRKITNFSRTL
jgi:hypothetical protein